MKAALAALLACGLGASILAQATAPRAAAPSPRPAAVQPAPPPGETIAITNGRIFPVSVSTNRTRHRSIRGGRSQPLAPVSRSRQARK